MKTTPFGGPACPSTQNPLLKDFGETAPNPKSLIEGFGEMAFRHKPFVGPVCHETQNSSLRDEGLIRKVDFVCLTTREIIGNWHAGGRKLNKA